MSELLETSTPDGFVDWGQVWCIDRHVWTNGEMTVDRYVGKGEFGFGKYQPIRDRDIRRVMDVLTRKGHEVFASCLNQKQTDPTRSVYHWSNK